MKKVSLKIHKIHRKTPVPKTPETKRLFFSKLCKNFQEHLHACNQEFFRAGELSWNQGTSIHLQQEKQRAHREKNICFFILETLKNFILNEKCYPQMTKIWAFFLQIRAHFTIFKKGQGRLPLSPSQYMPDLSYRNPQSEYQPNLF